MNDRKELDIAVKKLYNNILKVLNNKIQELYDSELSDEDKKLISIEDFASMYTIDFEFDNDNSFIYLNEVPKLEVILRLKTPEELLQQ